MRAGSDTRRPVDRVAADLAVEHARNVLALERLVGSAPAFATVLRQIPAVARGGATVLLTGETGTGKELVARAIHYLGAQAGGPFIPVNCGALPETLLEDELFGHVAGAFTDARKGRVGLIAQAHGGTLFLDEIDALTPRAQVSMLRVLQDRCFRPIGGSSEQRIDVRFVAASNADLRTLVRDGTFRSDLYYRLHVLAVRLPPLRERRQDVLTLARHFLDKHGAAGAPISRLAPDAEAALVAYDWPGNVRELENAMLRALCHAPDGVVHAEHLALLESGAEAGRVVLAPPAGTAYHAADPALQPPAPVALRSFNDMKGEVVLAFERDYLMRLMAEHGGNVSRAARSAGKERRELGKLLKKHAVDPRCFAAAR